MNLSEVLARPRANYFADDPAEVAAPYRVRGGTVPAPRPVQAAAILAMEGTAAAGPGPWGPRGIVGLIGCGHGKTLIAQLAPTVYRARRPALIVPAALKRQVHRMIGEWSQGYRTHRDLLSGAAIHSYEMISSINSAHYLDRVNPDLLVFDEAHLLGNAKASRWKRIARFVMHHPECRVVMLSGTLTSRSIEQMTHLFHAAIRDWTPFPDDSSLRHWTNVLDVGTDPAPEDLWYMSQLANHFGYDPDRSGIRLGLQALLASSRGVILSRGAATPVSLRMAFWEPDEPRCADHEKALHDLKKWELPDGTMLVDSLEYDRHSRSLSIGYFGRYVPPIPEEWQKARKAWSKVLRDRVEYDGFDSPGLVARAAEEGRLASWELDLWSEWTAVRHLQPPTEAIWVGKARDRLSTYAAELREERQVVWYASLAVESVLAELMPTHGSGSKAPDGRKTAAVSRRVHGNGWNGQAYDRCTVLEPPSNAGQWEQLLARLHRPGQPNDVRTVVRQETEDDRERYWRAIEGAHYIQDTTGEPQRLLYADKEE